MRNQLKDYKQHKLKFNPYLEKLYQSDKPIIIYKVKDGYNIYTDFSKKIILTKNNIQYFLKSLGVIAPHPMLLGEPSENEFSGEQGKHNTSYL